jgi:diguanylate cyclase (GGDEF)-like protein
VAFIDLDHFKAVNDSLGHQAGDRVLEQVAHRLAGTLRSGDTAARFGGDEFVVCLDDLGPDPARAEQQALVAVERIRSALRGPYVIEGGEVSYLDSSCGLALAAGGSHTAEALVRDADSAMYRAKQRGRATTSVFDAALRARAVERLSIEARLHTALEAGQFTLHYQPIVDLADGAAVGAEALLRWEEPGVGLHQPAEFMQVAVESGLIVPIGRWVLAQACRDFAKVVGRFGKTVTTLALNVAVPQLQRSDFAAGLVEVAVHAGLAPGQLVVEVPEQQVLDFVHSVLAQLKELADVGVGVTLDDFGTGYGSLAYLRRLPVSGVKIDSCFIEGMVSSAGDRAIARAVAGLGEDLGIITVAEGVEEEGQARWRPRSGRAAHKASSMAAPGRFRAGLCHLRPTAASGRRLAAGQAAALLGDKRLGLAQQRRALS